MKKSPRIRRKKPLVEEIEPRILYSADFAPVVLDPHAVLPQAEQRVLDAGGEFAASTAQRQASAPQSVRHEVVFVDTAVADYQKLVQDITANSDAQHQYDVVLLTSGADGIKQITQTLAGMHDISAVHIVSHGADGEVLLGGATLNFDSLLKNASQIKGWSQALAPGADLLIYGCDVAEYADGKALVDALSRLTGADVAASENLTGAAAQGGDWKLEYQDGRIETGVAVSLSEQLDWKGTLQAVAQGVETKANSTTGNTQMTNGSVQARTVAIDGSGNYVIVWSSNGQDGSGQGIYAQRYNAAGVVQGGEFRVNTTTSNDQTDPAVAMDANGNFVVAWSGNGTGDSAGVFARRYNAAGTALDATEVRVNTTTASTQQSPLIAMNESGSYVIAWGSDGQDGSGQGVYAQRYSAAGTAQGGEFRVNVTTAGDQWADSIAMDGAGNFIVAFSSSDGNGLGAYTRRYNAAGTALTGEVQVNTTTAGDQTWTTVAMNRSGAYVVAWSDTGADGSGSGIYAQRFDANGVAQGSEFRVNSTTAGDQVHPTVAIDASGNFTVVWSSFGQDVAGTWGVYKQDYNADGTPFGGETRVNTTTSGDQQDIGVAMNAVGQYVTVWDGNGPGDANGVFFQRYSSGLVVDTTNDTADGTTTSIANLLANKGGDGKISLREAILATNATANVGGPDRIYFNIASSGVQTITVGAGGLPLITQAIDIDATTERGFAGTPLVELNGTSAGAGVSGLTLSAGSDGSTIRGFASNRFNYFGILIDGSSNNVIVGNFLGTNAAGTGGGVGNNTGLGLWNSSTNNTIGGTTAADRNIISGNNVDGVQFKGAGIQNNVLMGNYIGLDVTGAADLGNANQGVAIFNGASNNTIGGTVTAAANVISGNNGTGVRITVAGSTGNVVEGNLIGTNAAGTAAIANSVDGVNITDASGNTIGGTVAGAGNLISGNTGSGISLVGVGTNNLVQGNYIGVNAAGTAQFLNTAAQLTIQSSGNTIGGTSAGSRNLIAGNVILTGASATNNLIQGNYIGINAAGTAALTGGGSFDGIALNSGAANNTIGGTTAAAGNVIAYMQGDGVYLNGAATLGDAILGNSIYGNARAGGDTGIDLAGGDAAPRWVTPNDAGDGDTGPNGLQNFPVLTSVSSTSAGTNFVGSFNSKAGTYRIEFFGNRPFTPGVLDGSGYGEGERFLGYITVTIPGPGSGTTPFNVTLPTWVNNGDVISATATVDLGGGTYGSTSEFSQDVTATSNVMVVDTASDVLDGTTTSVSNLAANRGADSRISLREAITATNNTAGPDFIAFAIPGAGPQTITLGSALPNINQALTIDGTTEAGFAGTPLVEISGNNTVANGLTLNGAGSNGSTIRGLAINRFTGDAILVGGSSNNIIAGNFLGTDPTGTVARPNAVGVLFNPGSANNLIGGTTAAARNIISGNSVDGIQMTGGTTLNNLVEG
ncbi:MAG TPA: DUF4347 domain-containing protein, partial [Burkholderiales bacterium]|nr:DUF4347 domain-containing protein [Burkholderiales bacterium]